MNKCPTCAAAYAGDVCVACAAAFAFKATTPLEPDDGPPLTPGASFHGLEVMELLGRGGMGVVYKARQPALDRHVALKILPRKLARDPEFRGRFEREAKTLAALSHPHIVSVYDVGAEGDLLYIVMEYVDGQDLRRALREKKLAPEQALRLVSQICDALQYAHGEGVVHRDIKPENILIDRKGRVKIADFGLAKLGEPAGGTTLTQTDVIMGTPVYMAPEQMQNTKAVDHRADIYSLGVVFYEVLTGELPVGRFDPPSHMAQVDERVDRVVLKALEKEPERRYQTAAAVRNDVKHLAHPAPPPAPRPLSWRVWAPAATILLGIVLYAAWPAGQTPNPRPAPKPAVTLASPEPVIPPTAKPEGLPPPAAAPVPVEPPRPVPVVEAAPPPPESQTERLARELRTLNPGFDGRMIHHVEGGAVTSLELSAEALKDMGPLKELKSLRTLSLKGTAVADLSPLAGLALERMDLGGAPVRDLSPLRAMPLKEISGEFDPRRDAAALRAISSLERINGLATDTFWKRHDPVPLGPVEPAFDTARWENALDLLALVHPEGDAVNNVWTRQGATLTCAGGSENKWNQIQIPYRPPEEYDLRVTFTRLDGNEDVAVYLIANGRPFYWQLGAWKNTISGFGEVQGKLATVNPTGVKREKWIENGRPYTTIIQVRKNGMRAFLGTELISQWLTDYSDVHWKSDPHNGTLLGLESCNGRVAFHEARLLEVAGHGEFTCGASRLGQRPSLDLVWEILFARKEAVAGASARIETRGNRAVKEVTAGGLTLDDGSAAEAKGLGLETILALLRQAVPAPSPKHRKVAALLMADHGAFDRAYAELAQARADGTSTRLETAFVLAREARQTAPGAARGPRQAALKALLARRSAALAELSWSERAWGGLQALVPPDAKELDGRYYMLIPEQQYFLESRLRCEELGGHLATISSPSENVFMGRLAAGVGFAWVGLCDGIHEGQWQWVTGERVAFTSWAEGQPNDDVARGSQDYVTTQPDGNWCDLANEARYFVCEWEKPVVADLLPLLSPQMNALDGGWVLEDKTLVSHDTFARARYRLPLLMPQEYDLRLVVECERGSDKLSLVLSSHMVQTAVVLNDEPKKGHWSWLGTAGAKDAASSKLRQKGPVALSGGPHTVTCRVRKNSLRVSVDDKTVIDWKGDWSQLAVPPGMENDNICCSSLCTWGGRFKVSAIELTPVLLGFEPKP